jgi:hypothetical protein
VIVKITRDEIQQGVRKERNCRGLRAGNIELEGRIEKPFGIILSSYRSPGKRTLAVDLHAGLSLTV